MKIREYLNGILGGFLGCLFCLVVFGTTFTYTYDKTTPAGTDSPTVLDDRDRETKLAVQERENVDHYWPYASFADVAGGNEVASAYTGEHRKITFYGNITDPTQVTGKGHLYMKGGELYYQDASNTALQLTNSGVLYSGVGLTVVGNATIGGTLDVTGNIDPTSYETTNGGFKDEDAMTSNSATAVASQQSIKKYVDDQDKDHIGTGVSKSKDTNYTAATSGKIVVMGTVVWALTTDTYICVKSDDNATPTTVVGKAGTYGIHGGDYPGNSQYVTLNIPIIKDKKYRVEDVGGNFVDSITFYPDQ